MKHISVTSTIALTVVSILLCSQRTLANSSIKIKTNEGTPYHLERKVMCRISPWRLESLLNSHCEKKRKRVFRDQNILQSSEKARSFLRKSTRRYGLNYVLYWEECCVEGCSAEEVFEHCVVAYR